MDFQNEVTAYNNVYYNYTGEDKQLPNPRVDRNVAQKPKQMSKNQKRKAAKQNRKNTEKPTLQHEFDAAELLFIPKEFSTNLSESEPQTEQEIYRRKLYIQKVSQITTNERRTWRAKQDMRYLHRKDDRKKLRRLQAEESGPTESSATPELCINQMRDRCRSRACGRLHVMRLPRIGGLCRFYASNKCDMGDECEYMHAEFPCRFYYLDLPHPGQVKAETCKFSHGGVLNETLKQVFLRNVEFWVKDTSMADMERFSKEMGEMVQRFEHKQMELLKKDLPRVTESPKSITLDRQDSILENVVTAHQMEQLCALCNGDVTIDALRALSIAQLEDSGLSIDQIYLVHTKVTKCKNKETMTTTNCSLPTVKPLLDAPDKRELDQNVPVVITDTNTNVESTQPILAPETVEENRFNLSYFTGTTETPEAQKCDTLVVPAQMPLSAETPEVPKCDTLVVPAQTSAPAETPEAPKCDTLTVPGQASPIMETLEALKSDTLDVPARISPNDDGHNQSTLGETSEKINSFDSDSDIEGSLVIDEGGGDENLYF